MYEKHSDAKSQRPHHTSTAPTTPIIPAARATAPRIGGGVGRAAALAPWTSRVTTAKVVAVGNTLVTSAQLVDPGAGVRHVVPANVPKSTAVAVVCTTTPGATVTPPLRPPPPPWTAGAGAPGEAPAEGAAAAGEAVMAPGEKAVTVKFWPATTSCVPAASR
jgi:hypothetical protein